MYLSYLVYPSMRIPARTWDIKATITFPNTLFFLGFHICGAGFPSSWNHRHDPPGLAFILIHVVLSCWTFSLPCNQTLGVAHWKQMSVILCGRLISFTLNSLGRLKAFRKTSLPFYFLLCSLAVTVSSGACSMTHFVLENAWRWGHLDFVMIEVPAIWLGLRLSVQRATKFMWAWRHCLH